MGLILSLDNAVPLLCHKCNFITFRRETDDRHCTFCDSEMSLSNEEHIWKMIEIDLSLGLEPGQII